jgi:hypothetical protein
MTFAKTTEHMSPQLLKVADRAKRDPQGRLLSLSLRFTVAPCASEESFHSSEPSCLPQAAGGCGGRILRWVVFMACGRHNYH